MKLWLIYQRKFTGYDTYDSAVVAAETEEEARDTDPEGGRLSEGPPRPPWAKDWPRYASDVSAEYLGEAKEGTPAGVILASFNAG